MKNLFYLYIFLVFPLFMQGQDSNGATVLVANAEKAVESGDREKAHGLFTEAAVLFKKNQEWGPYLSCGAQLVTNLLQAGEYEMGIEAGNAFVTDAENANYSDVSLSLVYKRIGTIYYSLYDNSNARVYLEKALAIREKIDAKDPELAKDYFNVAVISRLSSRSAKANEYLEKALELQEDKKVLAVLHSEMGINYKELGDFRKSLDKQEQAIRILKEFDNKKDLAVALGEKGATLTLLKVEGDDVKFLKEAVKLTLSSDVVDYNNLAVYYKNIGNSYFFFEPITHKKGFLDSAELYFNKSLEISTKYLEKNNPITYRLFLDLSSLSSYNRAYSQAQTYLDKGGAFAEGQFVGKSIEAAEFYSVQAVINRSKGNYIASLEAYKQQLVALLDDYHDPDIYHLPTDEQIKNSISPDKITSALALKARCLYQFYKYGGKDKKNLETAIKTIRLFDTMINNIRADFSKSGSNISWSDISLDAYENAIEICMALAKETGDASYKEQALFYSEKSKGLGLLEAFQNTKANKVAGLSEADLTKEREMKLDIADLEQKVFHLKQQRKPQLEAEITQMEKQIFIKREAYQTFLKDLETNNPQYYKTKYELNILNLEQMRSMLKDDQAIVEYFVGDSAIYAFKITKTEFEAFTLDGQETMLSRVGDFRKSIYGYFLSSKDRGDQMKSKYAKQYTERAHKMYQKLVEPLGTLPQRLIIIPAGPMCDMPFEPLLTGPVSKADQYKTHPYLLRKHVISYCYSATLLKEMIDRDHGKRPKLYLGMAPSFGESSASIVRGSRFALSPLAYNKPEINDIHKLLGQGDTYKDAKATEDQFKAIASDYQIIHFATHGMANSKDPDFSLLAFTEVEDGIENEFVYVGDLYNIELNADMVVLSACETALGKNFRGEGIMSLARGFSYAGAKSIFTTLWSVNDNSTYNIIKGYYLHLKEGMDKDQALQQSKLDYLEIANDFTASPFLWSPYILIGDTDAIDEISGSSIPWLPIAGGGFGILLLGFLGRRFMKKKEMV